MPAFHPKKILLIMFAPYKTVQMQIAALSAFLKEEGHCVSYLENTVFSGDTLEKFKNNIEKEVLAFKPDLVGFSSYDMNYGFILECSNFIKNVYPDAKIIVGGHHASLAPEDYMRYSFIDFVCVGEGEYVLSGLLKVMSDGKNIDAVPGLCFRGSNGSMVCNQTKGLVENLDELPQVDRDIVDARQKELDYLPVFAGKGCPFMCTYCSNDSMKKLYANRQYYVRYRSPERVIEEIKDCKKRYKFKYVYFYDDIFSLNQEWLKKFAVLYTKNFPDLPYWCLLNPTLAINEERIKLLADTGCRTIFIGVESGSQGYRQRVLKRTMTNKTILNAAFLVKKYKIKLDIFMMVGLPGESFLDMLKSLWLNWRIAPDGVMTAIYYPLKNTKLYEYCIKHNLINEARKKKILIFSYDTCLNYPFFKRHAIILFKWLNSATPLVRHFQFDLILHFLRIQYRKWFKRKFDYN